MCVCCAIDHWTTALDWIGIVALREAHNNYVHQQKTQRRNTHMPPEKSASQAALSRTQSITDVKVEPDDACNCTAIRLALILTPYLSSNSHYENSNLSVSKRPTQTHHHPPPPRRRRRRLHHHQAQPPLRPLLLQTTTMQQKQRFKVRLQSSVQTPLRQHRSNEPRSVVSLLLFRYPSVVHQPTSICMCLYVCAR
jgi:hypothetical protein